MTKEELVRFVAEKAELKRVQAEKAVEAFVEAVRQAAASGGAVRIPGFGSFEVRERAARRGRNPQTGAELAIPARKTVVFRPGKDLREAVQ